MFNPMLIFTMIWVAQLGLHVFFSDAFNPFASATFAAIIIVILFFNFGAWLVSGSPKGDSWITSYQPKIDQDSVQRLLVIFLASYCMVAFIAVWQLYQALAVMSIDLTDLVKIREAVILDFAGDRILYVQMKVFHFGVAFCIFFIALNRYLTDRQLVLVLAVGLVSAVLTTGRLFLLLYFLSVVALFYNSKKLSWQGVLYGAMAFFILFFLIALLMGKGDAEGVDSIIGSVAWNSQIYFLSSVACFNDFVMTDYQRIQGGALLPNPLRELLGSIGFRTELKPAILPFVEVPTPCNTYTFMFSLYHDGSFIGLALGSTLIGALHKYLYDRYKYSKSPVWCYCYAISIYALVMTVFEDAYFSSPGFWVTLLIPPIIFKVYINLFSVKPAYNLGNQRS